MPSILEQASKLVHDGEVEQVQAEKPNQFTVGATYDGHKAEGGLTYDRHWSNGWGATAYISGWWNDAPVVPNTSKIGGKIGVGGVKKF